MTQKETLSKMSINEREERARAMNWRAHKTEQGTSVVSLAKESARDLGWIRKTSQDDDKEI